MRARVAMGWIEARSPSRGGRGPEEETPFAEAAEVVGDGRGAKS